MTNHAIISRPVQPAFEPTSEVIPHGTFFAEIISARFSPHVNGCSTVNQIDIQLDMIPTIHTAQALHRLNTA